MELILKNVGRIYKKATIKFDGITILAGENGVGKSTIGKALFCMFNSLHNIEEKIYLERVKSVRNYLRAFISKDIVRNRLMVINLSEEIVREFYKNHSIDEAIEVLTESSLWNQIFEENDELVNKVKNGLSVPDSSIEARIIIETIRYEFGDMLHNANFANEDTNLRLIIKNQDIDFTISSELFDFYKNIDIQNDATYIGDTNVMDYMNNAYASHVILNHDYDLSSKIATPTANIESVVDDVLLDEKLRGIVKDMDQAGVGDVSWNRDKGWVYSQKNLKESLGIENISSGLKGFIQIKQLIKNGVLKEKDVLILDEPEVHMHPNWQKVYAEIIVKLQKEFQLTVLISTHSTDFLAFMEYYIKKYDLGDICNYYYLSSNEDGFTTQVKDVTQNVDYLYEQLGAPYLRVVEKLDLEG